MEVLSHDGIVGLIKFSSNVSSNELALKLPKILQHSIGTYISKEVN